jgi:hypothetical protein
MWDSEGKMNQFLERKRKRLQSQKTELVIEKDPYTYIVVTAGHKRMEQPRDISCPEGAD